ncbi:hypothetical protein [Litoribrevibacter albus]|uniref:Uncharacterized protein n=1 Tax=Litoribrevibacter albus TaxID=1473156 RepID=A0AA37S6Q2_9GAMM|nr:hypothetical protein [Litoribrevibacter albus]GLQ30022.1 hypothetical protein GCM10007876_05000 [Litoribrevibacter albus]
MFTKYLYIKVLKNVFEILPLENADTVTRYTSEQPFTTTRLLVGQFSAAETSLKQAITETLGKPRLLSSICLIIHPIEMCEGGLSQVEERIFIELGLGAGARKVKLHTGKELSPEQALDLLKSR